MRQPTIHEVEQFFQGPIWPLVRRVLLGLRAADSASLVGLRPTPSHDEMIHAHGLLVGRIGRVDELLNGSELMGAIVRRLEEEQGGAE